MKADIMTSDIVRTSESRGSGNLARAKHAGRLVRGSWSVFRAVLIIGICFIIFYPVFVQLSYAFMETGDLHDLSVHWIPRHYTLNNFKIAISELDYLPSFFNSLFISGLLAVIQLASCTLIGYGLARFKFPGAGVVFMLVVVTLLVPPSLISVPLFLNFRFFRFLGILKAPGINLIGSPWPLFMMSLTGTAKRNGLFIYITRQYFKGMSKSIEEAAYAEGCGSFKTFILFMLPNAIPVLLIVFLFSFVWQWNDQFYAEFFLKGREILSLNFQSLTERLTFAWANPYIEGAHIQLVSNAGVLLYVLPVLILYALLQRYFVESISRTGIVG